MSCIIGKSARFGIDHYNFLWRKIPELPHPVSFTCPEGHAKGYISFHGKPTYLDNMEMFYHKLGRKPLLTEVNVTGVDEIQIQAGLPRRFMEKRDKDLVPGNCNRYAFNR